MRRNYTNWTKCLSICAFIAFALLFWVAKANQSFAQSDSETKLSLAYDARFVGDEEITRIIIDFTQKPNYRVFYMEQPNRLVVELDQGLFQFSADHTLSTIGLINSARAGSITTSKARMVLSLLDPATIVSQDLQVFEGSTRHRLVMELKKTSLADFNEKLVLQKQLIGASGNVAKKGARVRAPLKKQGEFVVVIDPGHGGIDGGAVGANKTLEKEVTLAVSKLIAQYLQASGPYKAVLTRSNDVFLSLRERLEITKRNHADLMISLHADTLKQRYVRGATIYTLAKKASDKLSADLANSENLADLVAGLAVPDSKDEVTDILADLTLRETTKFSKSFSTLLKKRLAQKVTLINNPQRAASFAVLKNLEVPSILLELGYLSNKQDELLFNDDEWREKIAQQIVASITDFF